MRLRELAEPDLPALVALCRTGLRDAVTPELLRRLLLAEPDLRPELQIGLWDGARLIGASLGSLRSAGEELVGGPRLMLVAPERRGQGHGGRLLGELEQRLLAAGVRELRVGRLAPNYLWPGLDPRDTAALCMLEQRGYTRSGDAVNMDVDLAARVWWPAEAQAALAATGWALRRGDVIDTERLPRWVREHFGALWEWEARLALTSTPASIFLAEREGQIGGFACHSVSGLAGTFGPTGTDAAVRGAGLGKALLLRCLADLRALGFGRVEIGWVGPLGFYSRVAGAAVSRVCWFYSKAVQ